MYFQKSLIRYNILYILAHIIIKKKNGKMRLLLDELGIEKRKKFVTNLMIFLLEIIGYMILANKSQTFTIFYILTHLTRKKWRVLLGELGIEKEVYENSYPCLLQIRGSTCSINLLSTFIIVLT